MPPSYLSLAYPPTGQCVYKNVPPSFSPDGYDNLVAWYDSNSAVIQGPSNIITSWNDKTPYGNTIYPQPQVYPAYPVGAVTYLSNCEGISMDSQGNVYLAEAGNSVIRMYPKVSGTYFGQYMLAGGNSNYIIAGQYGNPGWSGDGAAASNAQLNYPRYASIDLNSNLFIADAGQTPTGITGSRIRMIPAKSGNYFGITMTGCNIYTIGGDGTQTSTGNNGLLSNATFATTYTINVDSNNNLYITDTNSIRMVPVSNSCNWGINMTSNYVYGIVNWSNNNSIAPSSGTLGSNATGYFLRGITFDSLGNLFYSDNYYCSIMMMPNITGNYYGQSMNSNCVYRIAGNSNGNNQPGAGPLPPYNSPALNTYIRYPSIISMAFNDVLVISIIGGYGSSEPGIAILPRTNTVLYGKQLQSNYIYELIGSNGYLSQQVFLSSTGAVINSQTSNIYACDYGYHSVSFLYIMKLTYPTSALLQNFDFYNITCTNQRTLEFKYPNTTNCPKSGATIFTVWKPAASQFTDVNLMQNLVSAFVDNMVTPGNFGANFSVGVVGAGTLTNFYIGTSDLSTNSNNTYTTLSLGSYTTQPNIINAICFNSNYLGTGYSRGYLNGVCVSSNTTPITLTNNQNFFNVYLGDVAAYINCNTGAHAGSNYIFETLVYNTVLSPAQISLVNQYLANKNGTAALANGGVFNY